MNPRYTCILFSGDGRVMLRYENVSLISCHDSTALVMLPDGRKTHLCGSIVIEEQIAEPSKVPTAQLAHNRPAIEVDPARP